MKNLFVILMVALLVFGCAVEPQTAQDGKDGKDGAIPATARIVDKIVYPEQPQSASFSMLNFSVASGDPWDIEIPGQNGGNGCIDITLAGLTADLKTYGTWY